MTNRRVFVAATAAGLAGCGANKEDQAAEVINVADESLSPQLLSGFHPVEQNSWRWTQSRFSVVLRPPRRVPAGAWLTVRYSLPEQALAKLQQTTLSATIEGIPLPPETITQAGLHEFRREVPAEVVKGKPTVRVDFQVQPFLPPGAVDGRELGLIVHTIGLVKKS